MKNKITKIIAIIFSCIGLATLTTLPVFADENDICTLKDSKGNYVVSEEIRAAAGCKTGENPAELSDVIIGIINGILGILATIAIVVIVIAGVQFMTSAGDAGKVKKAKDTILYASIGLGIAALAAIIVNFVIKTIS